MGLKKAASDVTSFRANNSEQKWAELDHDRVYSKVVRILGTWWKGRRGAKRRWKHHVGRRDIAAPRVRVCILSNRRVRGWLRGFLQSGPDRALGPGARLAAALRDRTGSEGLNDLRLDPLRATLLEKADPTGQDRRRERAIAEIRLPARPPSTGRN